MTKAPDLPSCPCCKNPWAVATGEFFAKLCETCDTSVVGTDNNDVQGFSRSHMDFNVAPAVNFYQYASGTWMKENPIPAGYPSWNTFTCLSVKSQENLNVLLEDLILRNQKENRTTGNNNTDLTPDEAKVAAFYAAALDEDAIEEQGIAPLQTVLHLIEEAVRADSAHRASCLGQLVAQFEIFPFFTIAASPDNKNSKHVLCQISQGGLGLPDRDYYFDEDKADKREAYKTHIAYMLTLLSDPTAAEATPDSVILATNIYNLEVLLAQAHMTKTENRDPEATYHKMSVQELTTNICKGTFDFAIYLDAATKSKSLGDVNVRNVAALQRVAEIVPSLDAPTLRAYLQWTAVRSLAPYLSIVFVNESFHFYETILSGTMEIKPRWKRAMAFTETALGEVLGQLYCAKHFDESCKERALTIVQAVRKALEERLREVDWMKADSTRQAALTKMSGFTVKLGYPDKWIDYSTLKFTKDETFLFMVIKARAFDHQRTVDEMNAPTNRDKWYMTPQTVNAYYHPSLNEIVFPAAILQHPFFNPMADDAVNFGSMAAVCGHEMTHGFDDKGRKFNADGNMVDWWTADDAVEYEKRVDVMVQQANEFVVHGQSVQGKLTCGENIADLGGLRLALRALQSQEGFDDTKLVDGFTPTQRFFLGWAQCWRQNVTKDRALQLLTIDPHGPNEMRCNGPLTNMPEFHQAFHVSEDSPMFRPIEKRVDIW